MSDIITGTAMTFTFSSDAVRTLDQVARRAKLTRADAIALALEIVEAIQDHADIGYSQVMLIDPEITSGVQLSFGRKSVVNILEI